MTADEFISSLKDWRQQLSADVFPHYINGDEDRGGLAFNRWKGRFTNFLRENAPDEADRFDTITTHLMTMYDPDESPYEGFMRQDGNQCLAFIDDLIESVQKGYVIPSHKEATQISNDQFNKDGGIHSHTNPAHAVAEALSRFLKELVDIETSLHIDGYSKMVQRFERWRDRCVRFIADNVSAEEAAKLSKQRMPGSAPMIGRQRQIAVNGTFKDSRAFIEVLIEEIKTEGDRWLVDRAPSSIQGESKDAALDNVYKTPLTDTPPSAIMQSLERFRKEYPDPQKVAFIMMRFGTTDAHERIVAGIKTALDPLGIIAVRADEREYHDDLFPNVLTYIYGCGFGIAVFERIESEEFNPNVALEVGYMFALNKPVCLLKDRNLKTLQADLVGKLYKEFDSYNPTTTIPNELTRWLRDKDYL